MASTRHRNANSTKLAGCDATNLLSEDHQKLRRLFRQFDALDVDADKTSLIERVCAELNVHAQLEEELFYPAAEGRISEEMLLDEAQVDHDCAQQLIEMLENYDLDADERDATFSVLAEYVLHHIEEEENALFSQMRDAGIDMAELGAKMQLRRRELHHEWGIADEAAFVSKGRDERAAVRQPD